MNAGDSLRQPQSLLRTALSLAARGWHVFPCTPGTKRPALEDNWRELATTDPLRIGRWWSRRRFNIGVDCGKSSLVVVDLDVPGHGDTVRDDRGKLTSGENELIQLCRQREQPYPETFRVETPSGGAHLYFAASDDTIRNSAGKVAPLIDVRAAGGYVIGPGSRVGRGEYRVIDADRPERLPHWLAVLLADQSAPPATGGSSLASAPGSASAYAQAALRYEIEQVARAVEGTRNDTLNRSAFSLGQLVGAGVLSEPDVVTTLREAAVHAGLTDREAVRTIRSGMEAGRRSPRQGVWPVGATQ